MKKRILSILLTVTMVATMLSGMAAAGAGGATKTIGATMRDRANTDKTISVETTFANYFGEWTVTLPGLAEIDGKDTIVPQASTFHVVQGEVNAAGKFSYTIPHIVAKENGGEWVFNVGEAVSMTSFNFDYREHEISVPDGEEPALDADGNPMKQADGSPIMHPKYKQEIVGKGFDYEQGNSLYDLTDKGITTNLDSYTPVGARLANNDLTVAVYEPGYSGYVDQIGIGPYKIDLAYSTNQKVGEYSLGEYFYHEFDILVLNQKDIDTIRSTGKLQNYGFEKYEGTVDFSKLKEMIENAPVAPAQAKRTASSVTVDGKSQAFDAYNIGGNNYFKLRDLAKVLSGSDKQFEVSFDATKNSISLISGKSYTPVGGELAAGTGATTLTANPTTSAIYLDSEPIKLTAYNIGGNNYFKLRDLGKAINFGVGWSNSTSTISIDTTTGYTE